MLTVPKLAHQPQLKKAITQPPSNNQNTLSNNLVPNSIHSTQKSLKKRILSPNAIKGKENIPIKKNDISSYLSLTNSI